MADLEDGRVGPASPSGAQLSQMRADLGDTFASGLTRSYEWRRGQLKALEQMLVQNRDALCAAVFEDLGKSDVEVDCSELIPCLNEVRCAISHLRSWMRPQWIHPNFLNIFGVSTVRRVARGTALIMGVWNFPIQLTVLPMVGALAAGNCMVVKPHRYCDSTLRLLVRLIPRYLDERAVRMCSGTRVVTSHLLSMPWDFVFFTGSPKVGRIIAVAQAPFLTPMVLELGGKSPVVVTADADLAVAARRICWGSFAVGSGQTCLRPDYLLVHESVAEELLGEMTRVLMGMFGSDPGRDWGRSKWYARIVSDAVYAEKTQLLRASRADPACRLVVGGHADASTKFISPTIFDFGSDRSAFEASALMADEVFAPILPVLRYARLDDALQLVNARPQPLAVYIFSRTTATLERCIDATRSGAVCANDVLMHFVNKHLPFGGVGNSGLGSYHGKHSFDAFTHARAVLRKSSIDKVPNNCRYPPWDNRCKRRLLLQAMDDRTCIGIWVVSSCCALLVLIGLASAVLSSTR